MSDLINASKTVRQVNTSYAGRTIATALSTRPLPENKRLHSKEENRLAEIEVEKVKEDKDTSKEKPSDNRTTVIK